MTGTRRVRACFMKRAGRPVGQVSSHHTFYADVVILINCRSIPPCAKDTESGVCLPPTYSRVGMSYGTRANVLREGFLAHPVALLVLLHLNQWCQPRKATHLSSRCDPRRLSGWRASHAMDRLDVTPVCARLQKSGRACPLASLSIPQHVPGYTHLYARVESESNVSVTPSTNPLEGSLGGVVLPHERCARRLFDDIEGSGENTLEYVC